MYQFSFDDGAKILQVVVSGFLTDDEASAYFADQELYSAEARKRYGKLALLVDRTACAVLSQGISEEVRHRREAAIQSPDDRIALVASSSLVKMQILRTRQSDQIHVFDSTEEARKWLLSS